MNYLRKSSLAFALACLAGPALADIQPLDGNWSGTVEFVGQIGCPLQVQQQLDQQTDQGYAAQAIDFPEPFDPVALQASDLNFNWEKLGPDQWRGTHLDTSPSPLGDIEVSSVSDITVLSDTAIDQVAKMTVRMPKALASMLGMTGDTCRIESDVQHRHD